MATTARVHPAGGDEDALPAQRQPGDGGAGAIPPSSLAAVVAESGKRKTNTVRKVNSMRAIASLVVSTSSKRSLSASSTKHLRESSERAVKDARGGLAVKSRASMGFGITTLYFYVLERSWFFCAGVFAFALFISLTLSTAACLVVGGYEDPHDSHTAALRYAASHVMTMGFGTVEPVSDASYALAVSQCFLGVLLNVFLFTFIITKFQRPLAHVLYADKVAVCTRSGERFVLIRVANLRCNTLHRPEVTLTLLRRRSTPEGEEFVSRSHLDVYEPPVTLTAVTTVSYKVPATGPGSCFNGLTQAAVDRGALSDVLLQVVVTAYDPIYDADVCAMKVYEPAHFAFNSHFESVMSSNEAGESVFDFDKIHSVTPQRRIVFQAMAHNSQSPRFDRPVGPRCKLKSVDPLAFERRPGFKTFKHVIKNGFQIFLSNSTRTPLPTGG